jgi:hypothetical protein
MSAITKREKYTNTKERLREGKDRKHLEKYIPRSKGA